MTYYCHKTVYYALKTIDNDQINTLSLQKSNNFCKFFFFNFIKFMFFSIKHKTMRSFNIKKL